MNCDCVTERGFPGLHLAIIYDNGSVWDFSFEEKIPKIKEKLLKLPKSGGYYGFSDDRGILYFLRPANLVQCLHLMVREVLS